MSGGGDGTEMVIGRDEKRKAAEREAAMRKQGYPRRVADRKMSGNRAMLEIAIMEAIAADYSKPALTDRQVELIRRAIVLLLDDTEEDDVTRAELHAINDALRNIQR